MDLSKILFGAAVAIGFAAAGGGYLLIQSAERIQHLAGGTAPVPAPRPFTPPPPPVVGTAAPTVGTAETVAMPSVATAPADRDAAMRMALENLTTEPEAPAEAATVAPRPQQSPAEPPPPRVAETPAALPPTGRTALAEPPDVPRQPEPPPRIAEPPPADRTGQADPTPPLVVPRQPDPPPRVAKPPALPLPRAERTPQPDAPARPEAPADPPRRTAAPQPVAPAAVPASVAVPDGRPAEPAAVPRPPAAGAEPSMPASVQPPRPAVPETRVARLAAPTAPAVEFAPREERASAAPVGDAAPAPVRPSFDIVRVAPDGFAVMAGRGPSGARIEIRDGGRVLAHADANAAGEWTAVLDAPLPPGDRTLDLVAVEAGGRVDADSSLLVIVPQRPTRRRTAEAPAGAVAPTTPVAVALPRDLTQVPPALLQRAGEPPAGGLAVDTIDYGGGGEIVMSGVALPATTARVYLDDRPVGDAAATEEGKWTLAPTAEVPPGDYRLRVDMVDAGGKVASRVEMPFTRADPAEMARVSRDGDADWVIVQPGNSLWRIARVVYGEGVRFTLIFEANQKQIRDPDLIYPGQIFSLPRAG